MERSRPAIDVLLEQARQGWTRLEPLAARDAVAGGALLVDIRPEGSRAAEGLIPGAVVIDRNVLEWRLDPTSPHRIAEATADRRVVLVCNEGYATSLAVATLRQLGVDATDVVGGFRAWKADGLPTTAGSGRGGT